MAIKGKIQIFSLCITISVVLVGVLLGYIFYKAISSEYPDENIVKPLLLKEETYQKIVNPISAEKKINVNSNDFGRENPFANTK